MELEQVDVVSDGPVTRVVLDRPERRNALSLDLMREVIAALDGLPVGCEAVVLEAAGPAFSAGHDLARDGRRATTSSTTSCSRSAPT